MMDSSFPPNLPFTRLWSHFPDSITASHRADSACRLFKRKSVG